MVFICMIHNNNERYLCPVLFTFIVSSMTTFALRRINMFQFRIITWCYMMWYFCFPFYYLDIYLFWSPRKWLAWSHGARNIVISALFRLRLKTIKYVIAGFPLWTNHSGVLTISDSNVVRIMCLIEETSLTPSCLCQ